MDLNLCFCDLPAAAECGLSETFQALTAGRNMHNNRHTFEIFPF
jgi:hypothetical protein